jgi:hypothetical protein
MPSPQGRMTAAMMRKMAMLRKGAPKKSKAMPSVSKGTPKPMPGFSKGTPKAPKRYAPIPKGAKSKPFSRVGVHPFESEKGTPKAPKRSAPIPKKRILKESPYTMRGGR